MQTCGTFETGANVPPYHTNDTLTNINPFLLASNYVTLLTNFLTLVQPLALNSGFSLDTITH